MKKIVFLIATILVLGSALYAQNFPYGFNFQALARDANGNAKVNASVGLQFIIRKGGATSSIIAWQEVQTTSTNSMGQFNVVVGQGTRILGTALFFKDINWLDSTYFLDAQIQTGATTYASIGVQQMMSVPYALATPGQVPAGSVMAFFGTTPPPGWLLCDGSAISRTNYATLYSVIGNSCGYGDNSTTFNVPDLRGVFLRGVDGTAGNDPDNATRTANNTGGNTGNNVGSEQSDAFQGHGHQFTNVNGTSVNSNVWYADHSASGGMTNGGTSSHGSNFEITNPKTLSGYPAPSVSDETRPKNVYVNYIIKY